MTPDEELKLLRADWAALVAQVTGPTAGEIERLRAERDAMAALLRRLNDAVEALDGTSVENESIVDDYRALLAKLNEGGAK